MPQLLRPFVVWLAFILAESVLGALRRLITAPDLEHLAHQVGVAVGVLLILGLCWANLRWMRIRTTRRAWAVGGFWVVLTVAFEIGLGRALGFGWDRILADYDLAQGGFMGLGLAAMALSPWAALSLRRLNAGDTP
jgi:hypothetical protein